MEKTTFKSSFRFIPKFRKRDVHFPSHPNKIWFRNSPGKKNITEILLLYAKYLSKKYFDNLTAKRNTRPFTDKMRKKNTANTAKSLPNRGFNCQMRD